ncbi:MAG: hypothetical protein NTZ54_13335 [Alphaproteobacteria bacterium]|uniref:hypothetical protein n=1 Tax=Aestuariivirga sp. TaxID=2650926 RepID=UPI003015D639|nr:hypothetical protein [Alphaproteobacteria bacterium]
MRYAAAPVAFALLASLFTAEALAAPGEPASIYQPPFMVTPPLATETPEQLSRAIAGITDFPKVLDPRIWTADNRMRPEISSRIMAIAHRQFVGMKLSNTAVTISDIELFGSNASYEYDEKADLSIHVFLNTASNPAAWREDVLDLDHFMRLLDDGIELQQQREVTFFGIPLTIEFHATRPPGFRDADGLPQYSVWSADASRTGRWININNPPPPVPKDAFDPKVMATKSTDFIDQYNTLVADYFEDKRSFDCGRFQAYQKSLLSYRRDGLAQDGQRSNGNLTYRLLRRLSINIPDTTRKLSWECQNIKDSLF